MGLFDNFQFDPQSFDSGGLLAQLRTQLQGNQPSPLDNAQWPAGPVGNYGQTQNVAVGDYQMPQFGQAPQPDPAAIPQNAQAVQYMPQQQQQAPQQETPGFGDRIGAGLSGFVNAGGPLQAIGNLVSGVATGTTPENQTVKALVARGLDPATAQTVARDPSLLRSVIPQLMGTAGQTDDIKEYNFAKREDPTLTFEKFMARKKSVTGEFGLTPIWGTGPDGKPAYIQPGKSGEARLAKLPDGFSIARDPIKVDAGTHFVLLDPQTRQPVGQVPKDLKGTEIQKIEGEAQGNAKVNLPNVLAKSQQTLDVIDKMIAHPGRETATGLSSTFDPRNYVGGTDAKNFQIMAKQLEGKTFLEAFEGLKGGGAITEMEGARASAAIARLDRAQSDTEYLSALEELKTIITSGMERARAKAGGQAATVAAPTGPSVDDLLKKYGG